MLLDPRGQRFAAAITSIVIALVLITGSGWLALAQAAVFAVTAYRPKWGPYPWIFRLLVTPQPSEPAAPVRFAQLVGFAFLSVSAAGYLAGAETVGLVAAAFGLLAAFLNAAFGLCLGCEAYLGIRRLTGRNAEGVGNV
ncbi:membrane protein [Actinoplanes sp. SE50]|uniref:DUF4395 domain-containing protein n=1 Tax=unclassified Actinoplanes TaxID=2626549 RepID=UPI00023EC757|nr:MULTISPECIES: DUF4395 domain-containing protein [unclassified Actinoplanes]AEV82566.1 hypothetical protein ACPL_1669 [Actinoplanes sp. SE50/110]ATO80962.1 membrane protein [Actinoplanes sp. SE50]SLL98369.1 membrane protein [Actinoplanes sp. SE50/110]